MEETIPLVKLYGENAVQLATQEIERLKEGSNIPFDKEYVRLGSSFMNINATEILEGKKKHCSLRALASKSFGEAAICRYNLGML